MSGMTHNNEPQGKKRDRRSTRASWVAFFCFALAVCLYLIRLEAHTHSDIFLPTQYHAAVEAEGPGEGAPALSDAALNAYYEEYARQEGRPYTIRQDLLLSRLAYIKAPPGFRGEAGDVTVRALCGEVERILSDAAVDAEGLFGRSRQEILGITAGIGQDSSLGGLVIREYLAHPSGLAGYVLEKDGEITMALRGTDDIIDMLDNFLLLPFNLSVQYAAMDGLLAEYGGADRIWLTGHSKGGHNAIYAASVDPRCRATGFNAPGFGIFLSDAQHDGLDYGINYVINGDVTGFLLFHLERRVVLEASDSPDSGGLSLNSRHRLDNFFSIDGLTVAARIQPLGIAAEWITQLAWLLILFLAGHQLIRLLKRLVAKGL